MLVFLCNHIIGDAMSQARIIGQTGEWEYVIGLEIHAQVTSNSKLFSGAATDYGSAPNSQVALVDAAMPGMLPVINKEAVRQAILTGIGLGGVVNNKSIFDRKNYFYPDLPQGYQISQFYHPIITGGTVSIVGDNGEKRDIRIHHIHLEQDAGKSLHDSLPGKSFIDLNRAGVALMEIVSEPDLRTPAEAAEYVKNLRMILRYLGACDGDMEKGSLRCDANVSVRKSGAPYGTRCEIKNVNSVRHIVKAIEYEAYRQVQLIESGGEVDQETRLFDEETGETRTMRSKENANDYRYFPDPDLLPLVIPQAMIDEIAQNMPELPDAKKARYVKDFGLSDYDADVLIADKDYTQYFEDVAARTDAKLAANWIIGDLFAHLNKNNIDLAELRVTPIMLSDMINAIQNDTISGKIAKKVLEIMLESGEDVDTIVKKHGLVQVADTGLISQIIDEVLAANQDSVEAYRSGKDKLFGFFVGQVMKKTEGKASPQVVNEILISKLKG